MTESTAEQTALDWFASLGYNIEPGTNISPGEPNAERNDYKQVVLENRLRMAIKERNPQIPQEAMDDAVRKKEKKGHTSFLPN